VTSVSLELVTKSYGDAVAIEEVSFVVPSGKFLTMLGPSGCGKSTTLRVVAGLIAPDAGLVRIGDRSVNDVPVWHRNVGMMFQSLALFPHMTAGENVAFGLRMRKVPKSEQTVKVRQALETVRLGHLEGRYPHQMSGGQQQRVALAGALVFQPDVLLLDEPFGALDRKLREEMQAEVYELTRRIGITSLFVTHDQEEALILSDHIAVMNHGRIEQFGTPNNIYERPLTRFVADFMGASNVFSGQVVASDSSQAKIESDGLVFTVETAQRASSGERVDFALRPEHVLLKESAGGPADASLSGIVVNASYHGAISSYRVKLRNGRTLLVREGNPAGGTGSRLAVGAAVSADWMPSAVHVLKS